MKLSPEMLALQAALDAAAANEQAGLAAFARGDKAAFDQAVKDADQHKATGVAAIEALLNAHPELQPTGYDTDEE